MLFLLKELIRAGVLITLLTVLSYYFVGTSLSTALKLGLINGIFISIIDYKRIKKDYEASKVTKNV